VGDFVVLYSKPVQGCLIHTYPNDSNMDIVVIEETKKFCKEYSCSARILELKFEIGRNGVVE
jgi:hypothetical protein